MSWLSQIFKTSYAVQPTTKNKFTKDFFEGQSAFKIGEKLWNETVLNYSISKARTKQKQAAALEFFDQAIEKGYDSAEVFFLRACCLVDLDFELDALEDFNESIVKDGEKANYYYHRSLTKEWLQDYEGAMQDLEEAIRLSKMSNEYNRYWNNYAAQTGFGSSTRKYELDLQNLKRMAELRRSLTNLHEKNKILAKKRDK